MPFLAAQLDTKLHNRRSQWYTYTLYFQSDNMCTIYFQIEHRSMRMRCRNFEIELSEVSSIFQGRSEPTRPSVIDLEPIGIS